MEHHQAPYPLRKNWQTTIWACSVAWCCPTCDLEGNRCDGRPRFRGGHVVAAISRATLRCAAGGGAAAAPGARAAGGERGGCPVTIPYPTTPFLLVAPTSSSKQAHLFFPPHPHPARATPAPVDPPHPPTWTPTRSSGPTPLPRRPRRPHPHPDLALGWRELRARTVPMSAWTARPRGTPLARARDARGSGLPSACTGLKPSRAEGPRAHPCPYGSTCALQLLRPYASCDSPVLPTSLNSVRGPQTTSATFPMAMDTL